MSKRLAFNLAAILAISSLAACSSDSKTTPSTSPSPDVATLSTPSLKPSTPSPSNNQTRSTPLPTPDVSRSSDPLSAHDPINDRSEEGIRLNIQQADENKSITYSHLKKNADEYDGEPWAFTGKIFQIQESGGQTTALIWLDAWGNKTIYLRANFTTEFVENNQVYVVGYLSGNYSYTSVAGWNVTVPSLDARAIYKPSEAARIKAGKKVSE